MSIDFNNIMEDMASNAKNILVEEGGKIGDEVLQILTENKESIAELAIARANGDIDNSEFESELAREKQVLEVQLLAMEIASKSAIQKAMNAAMSTLSDAVSAAL